MFTEGHYGCRSAFDSMCSISRVSLQTVSGMCFIGMKTQSHRVPLWIRLNTPAPKALAELMVFDQIIVDVLIQEGLDKSNSRNCDILFQYESTVCVVFSVKILIMETF